MDKNLKKKIDNQNYESGIYIKNLTFKYKNNEIFNKFSINFEPKKTTSLLGDNGIGKSTLVKLITGLETPFSGTITNKNNQNINKLISYMDQSGQLLPWSKIKNNIILGYRLRGEQYPVSAFAKLIKTLNLEDYLEKLPREISGGTKQRVALARTFIENRPIIVMDEPFSSLDTVTKNKLGNITKELKRDKTLILITHDIYEALELSDQIIVLKGKSIKTFKTFKIEEFKDHKLSDKIKIQFYDKILKFLEK